MVDGEEFDLPVRVKRRLCADREMMEWRLMVGEETLNVIYVRRASITLGDALGRLLGLRVPAATIAQALGLVDEGPPPVDECPHCSGTGNIVRH